MTAYIIKVVLCSGILLATYFLILENEKMLRFNRAFLLFSIAFSFAVPFFTIEAKQEFIPFAEPVYQLQGEEHSNGNNFGHSGAELSTPLQPESSSFNPFLFGYAFICFVLLIRFGRNFLHLFKKIRHNPVILHQHTKFVLIQEEVLPHSFLGYVFVNRSEFRHGIENEILCHEMVHVRQKHSLDILFMELLLVFCWFNPFFYLYRKSIQLNHEFLADEAVVKSLADPGRYQHLILNKITQSCYAPFASPFNYYSTKKRLIMMTKKFSAVSAFTKQIAVIPVLALMVMVFSTKLVAQDSSKTTLPPPVAKDKNEKDTTKRTGWVGLSVGHTKEGVSKELMKEYQSLVQKITAGGVEELKNVPSEDRQRMENIYRQMSLAQQQQQSLGFIKQPGPLPKVKPTKQQFESFKDPKVYGVWINEKKVPNSILNNYDNTDFSQVFISKLYRAAKKGKMYTHQLNLMTNDFYKKYYEETMKSSEESLMVYKNQLIKK